MHTSFEDGLSAGIRRLRPVAPGDGVRARVLAAMADAADAGPGAFSPPARAGRDVPRHAGNLATAAGIATVVAIASLFGTAIVRDPAGYEVMPAAVGTRPAAASFEGGGGLEPLIEVSWLLEHAIDALPGPRRVMRADTASTIAALETRIAVIDAELGTAPGDRVGTDVRAALWRDRIEAMSALYQVRFGQSRSFSF